MGSSYQKGLALLTLLVTGIQSRELVDAWRYGPYDQWGFVVLGVWVVPVFFLKPKLSEPLLIAALALCTLGTIISLNALKYLAFAVAVTALVSNPLVGTILILGSVAWMPAFGYFFSELFAGGMLLARLALACASTTVVLKGAR